MDKRASTTKLTNTDFEQFQKSVSDQMRQQVLIQTELLKSVASYRLALENMASASDDLAQAVGKLAVSSISSFQTNKEYHALIGVELPLDSETKQRNLSLALKQFVKYHSFLSQQHHGVSVAMSSEFERPIQINLDKFRDISNVHLVTNH